jgi:hypothetical protein
LCKSLTSWVGVCVGWLRHERRHCGESLRGGESLNACRGGAPPGAPCLCSSWRLTHVSLPACPAVCAPLHPVGRIRAGWAAPLPPLSTHTRTLASAVAALAPTTPSVFVLHAPCFALHTSGGSPGCVIPVRQASFMGITCPLVIGDTSACLPRMRCGMDDEGTHVA